MEKVEPGKREYYGVVPRGVKGTCPNIDCEAILTAEGREQGAIQATQQVGDGMLQGWHIPCPICGTLTFFLRPTGQTNQLPRQTLAGERTKLL